MNASTGGNGPFSGIGITEARCVSQTVAAGPCSATGLDTRRHHDICGFQHDETHLVFRGVVQHQRQVIERDDRMELLGENLEQLRQARIADKRLGDFQQGVVTREVRRGERVRVCHNSKGQRLDTRTASLKSC